MESILRIKESSRARHLRVSVFPDGHVLVTRPRHVSLQTAERFVKDKREWIEEAIARQMTRAAERARSGRGAASALPKERRGTAARRAAVAAARKLVTARVQHFNQHYGYSIGRISIRDQRTRWGSCSKRGNLNFTYRVLYLPPPLADYVIVHELCHRGQFNHSTAFWELVAQTIPDHKRLRKELRTRYAL